MDRITLTPIIRGAFAADGAAPPILLFDEKEREDLAELKVILPGAGWHGHGSEPVYTSDIREEERELGRQIREALSSLRRKDGSLPSGIRMPGVGSFYAGSDFSAAEEAKKGGTSWFSPKKNLSRSDVMAGRIALVTGGAQGFGAEIARGLAEYGANVIIADINREGAEQFVEDLYSVSGRRALALHVDVADEFSVKDMADDIVKEFGGLDLLVSNAGVLRADSVLELTARDFDFVTDTNYTAFFLVTKHCAPIMVRQQAGAPSWRGDIIQINSKSGLQGSNKNAAYAGAKFGGIGLMQSFAMELVDYGIKVNAVCPGNFFDGPLWSDPDRGLFMQYLRTGKVPGAKNIDDVRKFYEGKVPMGRGCRGGDVLKAILYCVEQGYETGQAVPVTGGQVMLK